MTEKPRFKRAFTDVSLKKEVFLFPMMMRNEVIRCYELIAEAERMAERIAYVGGEAEEREAREFLERLSK